MNITIEQIIETLKDENKRKKIEEIICDESNWTIISRYYIAEAMTHSAKIDDEESPTFRSLNGFNRFETRDESNKMARKINAELKLYHIAKHLNKGWVPNWDDETEMKYILVYEKDKQPTLYYTVPIEFGVFVFKSKEMLPEIIRLMGEQSLKDYFMMED